MGKTNGRLAWYIPFRASTFVLAVPLLVSFPYSVQAQTPIYYSVGTNTADLKSGNPTVTITAGTAVFTTRQPDFVGVGDEITYGAGLKAYISARTDGITYTVITATGGTPADALAGTAVTSIKRVFNSLSAATTGSAALLGTSDLVSGNYQLNWPCYNDDPDPSSYVRIEEPWVTGPTNYIRVYTPTSLSEVGVTQRHNGTAGTGYRIIPTTSSPGAFYDMLFVSTDNGYVRIEGIEIDGSNISNGEEIRGVLVNDTTGTSEDVRISHSIIHDITNSTAGDTTESDIFGIYLQDTNNTKVFNNIVYNITNLSEHSLSSAKGIEAAVAGKIHYVYNNTVFNIRNSVGSLESRGIFDDLANAIIARNNYVGSVDEECYRGPFVATSNNVSSDGTGNITGKSNYTSYFTSVAAGSENFHLLDDSKALWGSYGADLDNDPSLPVTDDIDGGGRDPSTPDIGADEYRQSNFRSIGSYSTGNATITAPNPPQDADDTVDFAGGTDLPLWVDPVAGERVTIITIEPGTANEDVFTIASRDSPILLTITALTTNANFDHTNSPYTIVWRYVKGNASVSQGGTTVSFGGGASLPTDPLVGLGDKLTLDPGGVNEEIFYILSRNSATEVTVQAPATKDHSTAETFWIQRAYPSLQDWEDARQGNLVAGSRLEVGVAYNDGPFTTPLTIDGSTTDPAHYFILTAAKEQMHNGTEGTGVVVDGSTANLTNDILVREDYTVIRGLEMRNHVGDSTRGALAVNASHVLLTELLVHDFNDDAGLRITGSGGSSFTARNCIVYNGGQKGIRADELSDKITVENCTVYGITEEGIDEDVHGSTTIIKNTISLGNGTGDICLTGSPPPCPSYTLGSSTQENNMSSDTTASGPGSLTGQNPLNEFVNSTGPAYDFHLNSATANAIDAGQDLSANFCCDIDQEVRPGGIQWDMGADEVDGVTAVELISFTATGHDGEVLLEWETGSELKNLGFHIYRAGSDDGPYHQVTAAIIPGLGSSPEGAKYSYRDIHLNNGETYYYKLEDIETTGKTKLHGPVSVTPREGISTGPAEDRLSPALITYGDPEKTLFRVLEHGRGQVVLELETAGFTAQPLEDGTVQLTVPGLEAGTEAEAPAIPVKRAWVEAIAGRKVKIVSVRTEDVAVFEGLRPERVAESEIEVTREGTVHARYKRGRSAYGLGWEGLYPPETARLVSVGFQGKTKRALVELAPLQWDSSTGRLLMARRLVVRLAFRGREPTEYTSDGVRGGRYVSRRSHDARQVITRLVTKDPGLYGIRYEDLFGQRRPGVSADQIRLSRQGLPVAFHIEPSTPQRFSPGSTLYFVSAGREANPFGNEAVYELELGIPGERMRIVPATPTGEAPSFYWRRMKLEQNRLYQAGLIEAPDRWLWDFIFSRNTKTFTFDVSDLASCLQSSHITVWLQGTTDFPQSPDHHVRVSLNGILLNEAYWEGKQTQKVDADLLPGLLHAGENTLEIENVGDTQARYSMVMLDRFEVEYPRRLVAVRGQLEGRFSSAGTGEISGLGKDARVLDITETSPQWLSQAQSTPDGVLRFQVEAERRYLATTAESVLRPEVRGVSASRLKGTQVGADYLMIGPRPFLEAAELLLDHRRNQGLQVKAVAIEEVFSEFGFGETDPRAIQDFLAYAYHKWSSPSLRYVVLLGDATFDFKDYLATGVANQVPPFMVPTSYLWTVSDPAYAFVNGEDTLPDFAIGRLPAATVEEARLMAEKIVAYETGESGLWTRPIVLVADNPDTGGNFQSEADEIATTVTTQDHRKIYLSELGVAETRASIVDAFNEGASVVSYLGHGGIHLWASENLFNAQQVDSLLPQPQQPLVLTMTCLNGYFHFPYFNALSEELLKAEGKGAIATISPSGLSLNRSAHQYHQALLKAILEGGHERLGDAVRAAQNVYAESGDFPELLSIYQLLGDPALQLK